MGKILIFGATGTVGAYTAIDLYKKGYNVVAIGKRASDNGFFSDYSIPYYSVDISKKEDFNILPCSDIDAIIHFAGAMPARMKGYDEDTYISTIINGTLNILQYMRNIDCNKIIFSQSISDILHKFGTIDPICAYTEMKYPLTGDHSVYSISKNAAVNLILHYQAQYKINAFILRLPTIYLYHPDPYFYVNGVKKYMGYRQIIQNALEGKDLEIWGNPHSRKEMVYVKDFTQLVYRCILSDKQGGIYNAGAGYTISIEDQIHIIADIFCPKNKKSQIRYDKNKPSSPQFCLDISNAIEDLGYNPCFQFREMMEDFKNEMLVEPFAMLWGYHKDYMEK